MYIRSSSVYYTLSIIRCDIATYTIDIHRYIEYKRCKYLQHHYVISSCNNNTIAKYYYDIVYTPI